jgi:hypothetical protein
VRRGSPNSHEFTTNLRFYIYLPIEAAGIVPLLLFVIESSPFFLKQESKIAGPGRRCLAQLILLKY